MVLIQLKEAAALYVDIQTAYLETRSHTLQVKEVNLI
jgi:hypothetical protein